MVVVEVVVFTILLDLTHQQVANQQVEQVVVLMVLDQNQHPYLRRRNHGPMDQQEKL
jgi:hypothetical protein|tara:strand:+ start:420 stop:590 length:171 start_codon:yes stop_codon:yes gene_type:complete